MSLASDQETVTGNELFESHAAPSPVIPLRQQVPVYLIDQVPHGFLSHLRVSGSLAYPGHIH